MGFFSRLTTLLKADAHGVVDALEDRALLLRQHVREAAAELERKKSRLGAFEVEERDLVAEAAAIQQGQEKLEADVQLALDDDKEELARFAIRKLLPLGRRAASIERRLEALRCDRDELAAELERQEADLAELESRAQAYLSRLERPEGAHREGEACWWEPVADEEVELELLRRRQGSGKGGA